ncbi:MAG: hypothetical protein R3C68_15040 [Myxococcota bacterium]
MKLNILDPLESQQTQKDLNEASTRLAQLGIDQERKAMARAHQDMKRAHKKSGLFGAFSPVYVASTIVNKVVEPVVDGTSDVLGKLVKPIGLKPVADGIHDVEKFILIDLTKETLDVAKHVDPMHRLKEDQDKAEKKAKARSGGAALESKEEDLRKLLERIAEEQRVEAAKKTMLGPDGKPVQGLGPKLHTALTAAMAELANMVQSVGMDGMIDAAPGLIEERMKDVLSGEGVQGAAKIANAIATEATHALAAGVLT